MGRCEKKISQERSHLGKSKIELAAGMYLVEIILTFQMACATNLDLTFGKLAFTIYLMINIFKKSKSMLHKNVQEKCRFGGGEAKEKAASNVLSCDLNKLLLDCVDNSRPFQAQKG